MGRRSQLALILSVAGTLAACSSHVESAPTVVSADTVSEGHEDFGPLRFRDIFYTYTKGTPLEADFDKLVYLAGDSVRAPAVELPAADDAAIARLDRHFSDIRPSSLYDLGASTPPRAIDDIESTFHANGAVTLVMIPGIFGEFIDNTPFQEVLSTPDTAAGRAWSDHLAAADASDTTDDAFSLDNMGPTPLPMSELMSVASIDDADGNALVNLVFLKPKSGSLETFGTLDDNNAVYLERLDKYFRIMGGAPAQFHLLGYSRGAAVALDLAVRARAEAQDHPWASHLGGVVTLGGVNYGTPLADAADPSVPSGKLTARLARIGNELEDCNDSDPFLTRQRKVVANTGRWIAAGAELGVMEAQTKTHPEIAWEGNDANLPELGRFNTMLKRIVFQDTLHLDQPVSDYCANVARFKTLVTKVLDGAMTLTTASRLDWWRTHVVPSDLKLFAITGTMGDRSRSESDVWPLVNNSAAYNLGHIDHKSLRTNYYDLIDAGGVELNDSQVPLPRGRFWPELFQRSNPDQHTAPETFFLGTLGTHHWGFAFPEAYPTRGVGPNPFPRAVLLKALGTFVAQASHRH